MLVMIRVGSADDIDITLLADLRKFIEEECIVGSCSIERGGALTHKQFKWW